MINLKNSLTILLILTLAAACSSKPTEDQVKQENIDEQQLTSSEELNAVVPTMTVFEDESTTQLIQGYLAVKDALVATDGALARSEAKKLDELLNSEEYSAIKVDLQRIAETSDPATQRQSFLSLSEQLTVLAKNGQLTSGNLFIQHCPMADGNKGGNWLSLSEDIKNPYYGDKMLTCGSVTEQL